MSSRPEHFPLALCKAQGSTKYFWGRCQGKDKVTKVERLGRVTGQRFLWWWCYSSIQLPYFDLLCCWKGFIGHFCVLFLPSHTSHLHAIKSIWAKFSFYLHHYNTEGTVQKTPQFFQTYISATERISTMWFKVHKNVTFSEMMFTTTGILYKSISILRQWMVTASK